MLVFITISQLALCSRKVYFFDYIVSLLSSFSHAHAKNSTLKEILAALDDKLTNDDLDGMINEIDADGSGTVDFDGKGDFFHRFLGRTMMTNEYANFPFIQFLSSLYRVHGDDDRRVSAAKPKLFSSNNTRYTSLPI